MQSFLLSERERLGLKQKDVFEFIGVNKATYYRWESGNPIPSDKLNELSKLGFDVNYVVTGQRDSVAINKQNYDRAMRIVMLYVIKSGREVADPDMFVQVVNEVYQVIEFCEQNNKEIDQVEIGAKVINLFAA
ncbi:putative transcriptional regulator [Catenovulum agarivorans DS-2]|uniref:Putative transcriptional regulator n=1 Tax=Catenovulum agarivorans DS-2 TaxID=1328313 RepID=W7QLM2_9ALTE|nr:helix-turn-helix transcriptional regulator [Catenovulum agarivorans]EWH09842.1 putative transcriptional regulator [Catenovulum agarivorans DS-2]